MELKITLILLCVTSYSAGQQVLECIRDEEDFERYNWRSENTYYAEDSSKLPGVLNGTINGRGIFYIEGSEDQNYPLKKYFSKRREDFRDIRPAYFYIKYYAHIESVSEQDEQYTYASPVLNNLFHRYPHSPDFTWREEFVELDVDDIMSWYFDAYAAASFHFLPGDYFLVDTFILAQGSIISHIDDIKARCPPEIEPTTTTEPSTTTTERPFHPILECIDNQQDFDSDGWGSYPPHRYAQNSNSLPADFGNLTGEGIFYFNEVPALPHRAFYKDYSSQFEADGGPAYVYLKYYVHQQNHSAYIQPVNFIPGEHSFALGPSTGLVWQEKLLEIDTRNTIVGSLMEIGTSNIQPGELLLVDKIIVSRGSTLAETLQQISSCLQEENVLIQNLLRSLDQK